MTLPSTPPLSGFQVATELGLPLPLSMNHAWVIALANKSALPVSFSDLLGKAGSFSGSVTGAGGSGTFLSASFPIPNPQLFDVKLNNINEQSGSIRLGFVSVGGSPPAYYSGNVIVTNVTYGLSAVLTPGWTVGQGNVWIGTGPSIVPPNGSVVEFTVYPHS